jgi:hypothetical protein
MHTMQLRRIIGYLQKLLYTVVKLTEMMRIQKIRCTYSLLLYNTQKYYVSPTQDGSEVSHSGLGIFFAPLTSVIEMSVFAHSDSWRVGNTPTLYPSLYRFQFPYRNKKG